MEYIVVYPDGSEQNFYILEVAEMYATINGGVVITQQVFDAETV